MQQIAAEIVLETALTRLVTHRDDGDLVGLQCLHRGDGRRGIDQRAREDPLRDPRGGDEALRAGVRGVDEGPAGKRPAQHLGGRVAAIESRQRLGMAFTDQQPIRMGGLAGSGLVDALHRQHPRRTGGQRMRHQRTGAEHIDDDDDAAGRTGTRDEVGVVDGQAPQARTAPVSRWTKSERR